MIAAIKGDTARLRIHEPTGVARSQSDSDNGQKHGVGSRITTAPNATLEFSADSLIATIINRSCNEGLFVMIRIPHILWSMQITSGT